MTRYLLLLTTFLTIALHGYCSDARVVVAVANPFVRNAIVQRLQIEGYRHIREDDCLATTFTTLFSDFHPEYVIVDGTQTDVANAMIIDTQAINAAYNTNVKKTIVLASFEIYPDNCPVPHKETSLATLKRDGQSSPYQIAKLTALKQCQEHNALKRPRFILCPHPYLCGPHDTGFTANSQHPIKNIAARVLKAKWQNQSFAVVPNDGRARYEIMHIDDLAAAVVFLLTAQIEDEIVNISYGHDTNVKTLSEYIKSSLKFTGTLIFDPTSFDDVPRHMLNNTRLTTLGWYPTVNSQEVIKDTVLWLESKSPPPYSPEEETPFILP